MKVRSAELKTVCGFTSTLPASELPEIAFAGRSNVGKSSLINCLLGENRVIVSPIAGTTRDSIDSPFEKDGDKYTLIDTAGIRRQSRINDDIEKSKKLAPGEYIVSKGTTNIGFASQSFQKARLTLEYGLKDGDAESVNFGCEVFRSWIRDRQQESGFFRRGSKPVPGKTFTDASEVGWAIGELSRTVLFLRAHRDELKALGCDADDYAAATPMTMPTNSRHLQKGK